MTLRCLSLVFTAFVLATGMIFNASALAGPAPVANSALHFHEALPQDAHRISHFIQRIRRSVGVHPTLGSRGQSVIYDEKSLATLFGEGQGKLLVLEDPERNPVLTLGYTTTDALTCELKAVYLEPAYQKRGLASFALRTLLDEIDALGFETVVLQTQIQMVNAVRLYEKFGFVPYPVRGEGWFIRERAR